MVARQRCHHDRLHLESPFELPDQPGTFDPFGPRQRRTEPKGDDQRPNVPVDDGGRGSNQPTTDRIRCRSLLLVASRSRDRRLRRRFQWRGLGLGNGWFRARLRNGFGHRDGVRIGHRTHGGRAWNVGHAPGVPRPVRVHPLPGSIVEGFVQRAIILVVVAFLTTAIVYGVAALIGKMLLTAVLGVRCRAVSRCRPFSSDDLRLGGGATRSTARVRSPHRRGPTRSCSSPTHQPGRRRSARFRCPNLTIPGPVVDNGLNRSGCSVPGHGLPEHRDTARSYEQANDDEHDAVENLFAEQRNDSGDDENDGQKPENECHGLSLPSGGSCQTLQPTLHPVGPLVELSVRSTTSPYSS